MQRKKICIVGTGAVGQELITQLMGQDADIIVCCRDQQKADKFETIFRALEVMNTTKASLKIELGYEDIKDADAVIITAGAKRQADQTRSDMKESNSKIIKEIAEKMYPHISAKTTISVLTNPVDEMTSTLIEYFQRKKRKSASIVGIGNELDTVRLKTCIAKEIKKKLPSVDITPKAIENVYVTGKHSADGMEFSLDKAMIDGQKMDEFLKNHQLSVDDIQKIKDDACQDTRVYGQTVIEAQDGQSDYHAASSILLDFIIRTILEPEKHKGESMCVSMPKLCNGTVLWSNCGKNAECFGQKVTLPLPNFLGILSTAPYISS